MQEQILTFLSASVTSGYSDLVELKNCNNRLPVDFECTKEELINFFFFSECITSDNNNLIPLFHLFSLQA